MTEPVWKINLTRRELATVLAALRYWQGHGQLQRLEEVYTATDGGKFPLLNADEIDHLYEEINSAFFARFPKPVSEAPLK